MINWQPWCSVWPKSEVRGALLHQCSPVLPSIPDSEIKNHLALTTLPTTLTFLTAQSLMGLWLPSEDPKKQPLLQGLAAPGWPYASGTVLFQIRNTACMKAGYTHQGHSWKNKLLIFFINHITIHISSCYYEQLQLLKGWSWSRLEKCLQVAHQQQASTDLQYRTSLLAGFFLLVLRASLWTRQNSFFHILAWRGIREVSRISLIQKIWGERQRTSIWFHLNYLVTLSALLLNYWSLPVLKYRQ